MTQTEQNSAVRTRDEQVSDAVMGVIKGNSDLDPAPWAKKVPVEARGAAEQRRKDAEGDGTPVYQWRLTPDDNWVTAVAAEELERVRNGYPASETRTLYTRPANVAAMEARIAELEGAITALFDGQCVLENRGWDEKPDRIVLYDDEQMASGKDPVSVAVRGANNVRAALTREGGV